MSMAKRTTTSFNIGTAVSRVAKPSVFDRIVKEISIDTIPAKYIEQILVQYYDGNVVELNNDEITHPIPINENISWSELAESFRRMRDVKIFINSAVLEIDINNRVEDYLGNYC